jgi:Zn-finger nucleic acid-binding protein
MAMLTVTGLRALLRHVAPFVAVTALRLRFVCTIRLVVARLAAIEACPRRTGIWAIAGEMSSYIVINKRGQFARAYRGTHFRCICGIPRPRQNEVQCLSSNRQQ